MNWETKLPLYLFLFYLFYGLFSWAEIGSFVPPIVIMPIIIPIVGVFYISRNIKSLYNVVYLFFSVGLTVTLNPFLSLALKNYIYLITVLILMVYSFYLIRKYFKSKLGVKYLYFPLTLLISPILFLENDFYPVLYFLLLGLSSFISYKQKSFSTIGEQRFLLLSGFTAFIYMINFLPCICNVLVYN